MPYGNATTKPGYVYVILGGEGHCKIGYTGNLASRLSSIQTGSAAELTVVCVIETVSLRTARQAEALLHAEFADLRVRGEWFALGVAEIARIVNPSVSDPLIAIRRLADDDTVTKVEAAKIIGVTPRRIDHYVSMGLISSPPPFDRAEILALAVEYASIRESIIG